MNNTISVSAMLNEINLAVNDTTAAFFSIEFVKKGNNDLKIEVVNNWMNRLIGDMKMPEKERPTWAPVVPYNADSPLQPSGLFGPVKIVKINQ